MNLNAIGTSCMISIILKPSKSQMLHWNVMFLLFIVQRCKGWDIKNICFTPHLAGNSYGERISWFEHSYQNSTRTKVRPWIGGWWGLKQRQTEGRVWNPETNNNDHELYQHWHRSVIFTKFNEFVLYNSSLDKTKINIILIRKAYLNRSSKLGKKAKNTPRKISK